MDSHPSNESEALRRAVAVIGSQSAMGRLLKISQAAVSKWLQKSLPLPAEHVLDVERATGISRHELRPDIYPVEGQASRRRDAVPDAVAAPPVREADTLQLGEMLG